MSKNNLIIFNIHLKNKKIEDKIRAEIDQLAGKTEGFTGADIEEIINIANRKAAYRKISNPESPMIMLFDELLGTIEEKIEDISKRNIGYNKEKERVEER